MSDLCKIGVGITMGAGAITGFVISQQETLQNIKYAEENDLNFMKR